LHSGVVVVVVVVVAVVVIVALANVDTVEVAPQYVALSAQQSPIHVHCSSQAQNSSVEPIYAVEDSPEVHGLVTVSVGWHDPVPTASNWGSRQSKRLDEQSPTQE
jgi:hypothetical protein